MRFENINGVQHIILDENDKISITTEDSHGNMTVDIKCQDCGLNITGSSSLINTIKGEGMLEKVFIQPTLSADEIIEKCNQWLEMFKKVHDKFRKLVLTDGYRKQNITMELSFGSYFSFSDKNIKGRKIGIDLRQHSTIIQEGVSISIDEVNEEVYKYLLANVLVHYLSVNYTGTTINNLDIDWDHILYSNNNAPKGSTIPIVCRLSGLYESSEYERIVTSIIFSHNINQSSEQLIDNLRQAIYNQQLSDRFDSSINYSSKQYEHIISNSEDELVLLKKRN